MVLAKINKITTTYYIVLIINMLTESYSIYWLGTEEYVTIWNILAHVF